MDIPPCILDAEMAAALTKAGLWHGRASLEGVDLEDIEFEREEGTGGYLAPFGGLYVTGDFGEAGKYADEHLNFLKGGTGRFGEAEHQIHQIEILPGAEVALDEDLFGWGDLVYAWRDGDLHIWYGLTHPSGFGWTGPMSRDFDLRYRRMLMDLNLVDTDNPEDFFEIEPSDFYYFVEEWTYYYVCAMLRGWMANTGMMPPKIRILNDRFRATPGLPAF